MLRGQRRINNRLCFIDFTRIRRASDRTRAPESAENARFPIEWARSFVLSRFVAPHPLRVGEGENAEPGATRASNAHGGGILAVGLRKVQRVVGILAGGVGVASR